MTDDGNGSPRDFADRLRAAQARQAMKQGNARRQGGPLPGNMLGMAYRISIELVVPPLVGAGLGWLLDNWLGTKAICLLILFLLGSAAGVMNVMRAMRNMGGDGPKGPDA